MRCNLKMKAELDRAMCDIQSTTEERMKMLPYLLKDTDKLAQHVFMIDGNEFEYTRGMYYKKSHTMPEKSAFG